MPKQKSSLIIIPFGILLGLSFFFFSFKISQAETILAEQTQLDNATGFRNAIFPGATYYGLYITNKTGTFNQIELFYTSSSTIDINDRIDLTQVTCGTVTQIGAASSSQNVLAVANELSKKLFTFTNTITLNSSLCYFAQLSGGWTGGLDQNILGTTNTTGTDTRLKGNDNSNVANLYNPYYRIGSNLNTQNSYGNWINLTYPTNGSLVNDFYFWNIDYSVQATSSILTRGVKYGTTTNFAYDDYEPVTHLTASTTVFKNRTVPVGNYYAQAYISANRGCDNFPYCTQSTNYDIATSSIIQFSLISSGDAHFPTYDELQPNATSTGNIFEQCEQILGSDNSFLNFWGAGFCKASKFLFEPHQISFTAIDTTVSLYKTVFPFNVFFGISDSFKNSLRENENQAGTNLEWNAVLMGNNYGTISFLTPTFLEDTFGSEVKNLLFTVMTALLWIGIGIKCIKQFV